MAPKIGYKQSEETKQHLRESMMGNLNSLGRKLSEETKKKIGNANTGKNNGMWKDNGIGYAKLHQYLRRHLLEPKSCPNCNSKKKLDLSNMTGKYNRDFSNWKYLCRSCHRKYDSARRKNATNMTNISSVRDCFRD